ncbi:MULTISPECIES: GlsB/YeaQ/YmgE family stress response membrane protein [Planomicrobium]|uniref:GlsB/YeaQ/YmgE family stress response membrane protein n=1 Tax=Planomicrobium okeanokoites TaxID=244 RepID=A0ABV7KQ85_PLAOK|nr:MULTISPECIES: GlsB/YeaQ/YmgE family stress response membrane protein [Planomicrobium]PKH08283.1 GlsB/YeaQ/YmgE family stress response membrane protein [Planomicrobium sp. MB-3u-38]TAA71066.1 GlsB/YeaQ/YmgE family stress response membrane protein [Planomicrobium okeanokoites]
MGFILFLIMGGIIGWLAGLILGKDVPGGIIGNIIAGIIGAWLGSLLLGDWGPEIWGVFIIPALIGALILVFVLSLILGSMGRNRRNRA